MAQDNIDDKFFIESLWVLDNVSGICVFEENYVDFTNEGMSTDLIGSFLSALLTFADETFTDEIQHVQFSNRKIIFKFSEFLLFIIAVNEKAPISDFQVKKKIDEIAKVFNAKYQHIFDRDEHKWGGNISQFESFSEDLRKIVKREPLSIKFLQLFDFKDNFKKLEDFFDKRLQMAQKHKERFDFMFKGVVKKKRMRRMKKLEDSYKY